MASGIPVLCMMDGEGSRIIQDSSAGITCPAGDSNALADRALSMSRLTATELKSMGERGKVYSENEFDRDILISRLETLLVELVCKYSVDENKSNDWA